MLLSLVLKSALLKSKNDNSPSDRDLKIFKQSKLLRLSIERKKNFSMIIANFRVGKPSVLYWQYKVLWELLKNSM